MSNSLRSGLSLVQSMEMISREAEPPIADEFQRVVREIGLGVGPQDALLHLVRRVNSDDLELLVTAILVQFEIGGNLSRILDSIAGTIRERVKLQGEIRTMSAQGRMAGYMLSGMPVAIGGMLMLIAPSYMGAAVHAWSLAGAAGRGLHRHRHGLPGHSQTRRDRGLAIATSCCLAILLASAWPARRRPVPAAHRQGHHRRTPGRLQPAPAQPRGDRAAAAVHRTRHAAVHPPAGRRAEPLPAVAREEPQGPQVKGLEAIQRKLALAGNPYRWTPADFLGMKAFAALVLGGVLFFLMTIGGETGYAFLFGGIGVAFGWFGPELLLRSKTQRRQKRIQRALPDALDLLVISVEAGTRASTRRFSGWSRSATTRCRPSSPASWPRCASAARGATRSKDMVLRTQVADLNNFVGAILQAEQLGVSVTKVLTVQAEQMRVLRRQRAEEKAAQLQLKLIFPLAIFIFPALCVVIMGPIWPTLAGTNAAGV